MSKPCPLTRGSARREARRRLLKEQCDDCRGKGWVSMNGETRTCAACHGTGISRTKPEGIALLQLTGNMR